MKQSEELGRSHECYDLALTRRVGKVKLDWKTIEINTNSFDELCISCKYEEHSAQSFVFEAQKLAAISD